MKNTLNCIFSILILTSCGTPFTVRNDSQPLEQNEGYLGLVINSIDKLANIEFRNVDQKKRFYIGSADIGTNLYLLKLPEGEYCFIGFDAYDLRIDFKGQGFCTYIEADELNYFNHFTIRDPITNAFSNYNHFIKLLNKEHTDICNEYIGEACQP